MYIQICLSLTILILISQSPSGQWRTGKNGGNWLWNHLWCPNDPLGEGIGDDDDDDDDDDDFDFGCVCCWFCCVQNGETHFYFKKKELVTEAECFRPDMTLCVCNVSPNVSDQILIRTVRTPTLARFRPEAIVLCTLPYAFGHCRPFSYVICAVGRRKRRRMSTKSFFVRFFFYQSMHSGVVSRYETLPRIGIRNNALDDQRLMFQSFFLLFFFFLNYFFNFIVCFLMKVGYRQETFSQSQWLVLRHL